MVDKFDEKIDRAVSDLDKVLELYATAEKMYPYSKIRDEPNVNENAQRRNVVQKASYLDGSYKFGGQVWWGVGSMLLLTKLSGGALLDTTCLTRSPLRTINFFLAGVILGTLYQAKNLKTASHDTYTFNLHKRVAENEQSHAVLQVLKFNLQTARKMSVWDMNS